MENNADDKKNMNSNKIGIIIIIILTIILIAVIGYLVIFNKNDFRKDNDRTEINDKVPSNKDEEDNTPSTTQTIKRNVYDYLKEENKIVRDTNYNEVIYDSSKVYAKSTLDDLTFLDKLTTDNYEIAEYLKYFLWVFTEQTKTSFTEEDMAIIISLAADMIYTPRDSNYIKNLGKRYFNVDNYELITGTYDVILNKKEVNREKYSIMKKDDFYLMGGLIPTEIEIDNYEYMTDIKVDNDKVTVYYDYASSKAYGGCYSPDLSIEEKELCRLGYYKINITMDKDKQIFAVNSIEYIKNK